MLLSLVVVSPVGFLTSYQQNFFRTHVVRHFSGVGAAGFALGGGEYPLPKFGRARNDDPMNTVLWSIGYSWFSNKYGLTVDSMVSYELVLPNATVATVTSTTYPDLFFGLKGGFLNFVSCR